MKNEFKNQNFKIFEEVVNNCGRSDDDMTCEEIIISTRCIPINVTMVTLSFYNYEHPKKGQLPILLSRLARDS